LKRDSSTDQFLRGLPKAELHVHIEGTLEAELMFEMAARNGITLRYESIEALRAAYRFSNLQEFLDIYYLGAGALQTERDFYDMTLAYLRRAAADGVRRAEIFFDPQTHTDRGLPFGLVIEGLHAAIVDGERDLGISSGLIMCFLRHLPAEAAMATLEQGLAYRGRLLGVGLDSSEVGFPPSGFIEPFAIARSEGLHLVAHAGEEGPPAYIWEALDLLHVERIDHGVRCFEDPMLVRRLATDRIPLTVCPLSNVKLGGFTAMEEHNLPQLLAAGVMVTLNSDDPAYFGGYIGENYIQVHDALGLDRTTMVELARNSIEAAFITNDARRALIGELDDYAATS